MDMAWYERYAWRENPFEIKPMPELIYGFNEIRKDLLEFIKSGDCCLIIGETGMGKTVLLKWLAEFALPGTVPIYLNTLGMNEERLKKINIDEMIRVKLSFWDRLLRRKKMLIFLIDEAQSLPAWIGEAIKRNFDNKFIDAVVLASITDDLKNLKGSLLERIGNRKIKLRPMTNDEAMGMVNKRIKHLNPFGPGSLEVIFRKANFSPRAILEICELVAKANKERIITKEFVEKYLELKGRVKAHVTEFMEKLSPLQGEIVNILKTGNFTPSEIAKKLKKPTKTITSQLAYLGLKSGVKVMKRKGINFPVVEKSSDRPAIYRLTAEAKRILVVE